MENLESGLNSIETKVEKKEDAKISISCPYIWECTETDTYERHKEKVCMTREHRLCKVYLVQTESWS